MVTGLKAPSTTLFMHLTVTPQWMDGWKDGWRGEMKEGEKEERKEGRRK